MFEKENGYVLTRRGEEFLRRFEEYDKQRKQLEEKINSVKGERVELEKMLFDEGVNIKAFEDFKNGKRVKEDNMK